MISEKFLKFFKCCNSQQQTVLAAEIQDKMDPEVLRFLLLFYITNYKK